jgi:hypothetical protein
MGSRGMGKRFCGISFCVKGAKALMKKITETRIKKGKKEG